MQTSRKLELCNRKLGEINDTLFDYQEDEDKLDAKWKAGDRTLKIRNQMHSIHRCKRPLLLRREELIEKSLMLENLTKWES